jgi:uncharacterized membrane protein YfcA
MLSYLLLVCAAFVAGIMNAIAGGGSLLTFPALVFTGVPSVVANASSTVALFPGAFASAWGYRHDITGFEGVSFKAVLGVSFAGGAVGSPAVALHTAEDVRRGRPVADSRSHPGVHLRSLADPVRP